MALNEVSANELFAEYMEQIENVIAAVDKLGRIVNCKLLIG